MKNKFDIFIFSGETSGDKHGALLIDALHAISPKLKIEGVAGPKMRSTKIKTIMNMEEFQVMGFYDVIKNLPKLLKHFRTIRDYILDKNPKAVVFIDYPEFNMKMAKALRKKGFKGKLIQYVCPTVWAWRKNRIKSLIKTLDLLITIFPFEDKYFEKTSLPVCYIGNPLANVIKNHKYKQKWKFSNKTIAIFPGSRKREIKENLPNQLKVAEKLTDYHIAISAANEERHQEIEELLTNANIKNIEIITQNNTYELMKECHAAIATLGTITLELALHNKPTVTVYKPSLFNLFVAGCIFRIILPFYCIVNIIANKEVFPELIHFHFTSKRLLLKLKKLLEPNNYKKCVKECQKIKKSLIVENGIHKAAKKIIKMIS